MPVRLLRGPIIGHILGRKCQNSTYVSINISWRIDTVINLFFTWRKLRATNLTEYKTLSFEAQKSARFRARTNIKPEQTRNWLDSCAHSHRRASPDSRGPELPVRILRTLDLRHILQKMLIVKQFVYRTVEKTDYWSLPIYLEAHNVIPQTVKQQFSKWKFYQISSAV